MKLLVFCLYSWQPFAFNFACETPEKKKTHKNLQLGTREWTSFFQKVCMKKTPCILCQHALELTV